jgi:hypothetical protein
MAHGGMEVFFFGEASLIISRFDYNPLLAGGHSVDGAAGEKTWK